MSQTSGNGRPKVEANSEERWEVEDFPLPVVGGWANDRYGISWQVVPSILPEFLAVHLVRLERYGMLLLLLVVFILPRLSGITGHSFDFIELLEGGPVAWIIRQIGHVTGVPA